MFHHGTTLVAVFTFLVPIALFAEYIIFFVSLSVRVLALSMSLISSSWFVAFIRVEYVSQLAFLKCHLGRLDVVGEIWLTDMYEIRIGKWSLPYNSGNVSHVSEGYKSGLHIVKSIDEKVPLADEKCVGDPVFKIVSFSSVSSKSFSLESVCCEPHIILCAFMSPHKRKGLGSWLIMARSSCLFTDVPGGR